MAYTCLLLAGALPVPPIGIAYLLAIRPIHDLRGYGMLLGVALGIPALGATIVGLFYMLMLLRVRHIQRVMLPVVVGFPLLIAALRSEQWQRVALAAFLVSLIVVSSRGLAAVRRADSAAASAP